MTDRLLETHNITPGWVKKYQKPWLGLFKNQIWLHNIMLLISNIAKDGKSNTKGKKVRLKNRRQNST